MKKILVGMLLFFIFLPSIHALEKDEMTQMNLKEFLDINIPNGYMGFQGFTITDKYIVAAAVMSDDSKQTLYFIDKATFKVVTSKEYTTLGHANSLAFDAKKNKILVLNGNKIIVIDAETLEENDPIPLSFSGVTFTFSHDVYYFWNGKTIKIYDINMNFIKEFDAKTNLVVQGIAFYDGLLYLTAYEQGRTGTYEPVYDGILEAGANSIYVYDTNGEYKNTFYIPTGYGEIEDLEFLDGKYYLMFNSTNKKGIIYTPVYENVNETIAVKDSTIDFDPIAALYDQDGNIGTVSIQDGKYTFHPITYVEPGEFTYTIKRLRKTRDITSDEDVIQVLVHIDYTALKNQLIATVDYEKESFEPIQVDQIDDYDNNEVIDTPIRPGDSSNETLEPGTVENPQTGAYLPWIIIPVGLGVITAIVLYRKKVFFKL